MTELNSITFLTKDHPEANGREAQPGEEEYMLNFPLEDGRVLYIKMGRIGHEALFEVLSKMHAELEKGS